MKIEIESFKNELRDNVIDVSFTKKDGTLRQMKCSLKQDLIPACHDPKLKTSPPIISSDLVRVFDLENDGWRTIILDSIIEWTKGEDPACQ